MGLDSLLTKTSIALAFLLISAGGLLPASSANAQAPTLTLPDAESEPPAQVGEPFAPDADRLSHESITAHPAPLRERPPSSSPTRGVQLDDWEAFSDCLSGPDSTPNPQLPATADGCLVAFDWDDDGDVDLLDSAAFQRGEPVWLIEPMGAWGGPVNAFEKHGDTAYIGSGQRLVVLDMTDPTDVRELGAVRLGSAVMDLKVRDGLVYVVTLGVGNSADAGLRRSWFHVVDAADPAQPELIWSDPGTTISGHGGAIYGFYGDYAFLRDDLNTREIVADLTDPRNPVLVGDVLFLRPFPDGNSVGINEMVIRGDLAFVATTETIGRMRIFDLSTIEPGVWPMEPAHVGAASFLLNRFTYMVAVENDWAYVMVKDTVAEQEVLWAVDVSDPASPVKRGSFDGFVQFSNGYASFDMEIAGGRLYVANGAKAASPGTWDDAFGLATFDIASDPGQPALIATHRTHGSVRGVSAEGDTLFLRDWGEGLIVMDTADPADPVRLGNYHSPALPKVMERVGDLLYVSDDWNGLSILDVADLSDPVLLGVYQTPERLGLGTSGLAYLDGLVYLAAGHAGLEVIDVSDPTDPVLHGAIRFPDEFWHTLAVAVDTLPDGSRVAYLSIVVPGSAIVASIDVTDPASLVQLDLLGIAQINTFARASVPGRFFIASWHTPVLALDGSNPADLQIDEIAGHPTGDPRNDALSTSYDPEAGRLYLAIEFSSGERVVAIDMVSDSNGVVLNTLDLGSVGDVASHPEGVVVIGGRNIGGEGPGGRVALVDMVPPSPPRVLASTPVGFGNLSGGSVLINRVLASDEAVFVTNGGPVGLVGLETFSLRRTADRNADGVVDLSDLSAFLAKVRRGAPSADLTESGVTALGIQPYMDLRLEQPPGP